LSTASDAIPVNVLTGSLGSGKTTLLTQLLRAPEMAGAAVLVNEFGEVGLDHHLLEGVSETALLLENGCICCTVRGDLRDALRTLFDRRERGSIPPFDRVVVETSGLADPVPIAYTLLSDIVLQHHFRLGQMVVTVDAVNIVAQLDRHPETAKQLAVADHIVLTKGDLVDADGRNRAHEAIRSVNGAARIVEPHEGTASILFADDSAVDRDALNARYAMPTTGLVHDHTEGVRTLTLRYSSPIDWTAFGVWMTLLLARHGDNVLRIKGLVQVTGLPGPVLINGVQHIVHPPRHLPMWPSDDRESHVVIIAAGLDPQALRRSLDSFMALPTAA
jgi:G3E family GTPase